MLTTIPVRVEVENHYPEYKGSKIVQSFQYIISDLEVGDTLYVGDLFGDTLTVPIDDNNIEHWRKEIRDNPFATSSLKREVGFTDLVNQYAKMMSEERLKEEYDEAWENRYPVCIKVFGTALQIKKSNVA